jgi:hypothetical protein
MAGLDPAIHVLLLEWSTKKDVDGRERKQVLRSLRKSRLLCPGMTIFLL